MKQSFAPVVLAFFLAAWLPTGDAHGQSREISVGVGLISASVVDEGFSPLVFTGLERSTNLSYAGRQEGKESLWLLDFTSGTLQNRHGRRLHTSSLGLLAVKLYRPHEASYWSWGWANGNRFHARTIEDFQNWAFRADGYTAFGPAAKYSLAFHLWNQNFTFEALGHVQLIGFYIPSGYVDSRPPGFGYEQYSFPRAVLRSAFLFHPGSAANLGLLPSLHWELGDRSTLLFSYSYEYSSFRNIHPSRRSQGNYAVALKVAL